MIDASRRSALGVLASGIVHGAIVLGMHGHGRASERTRAEPLWLELHVEPRVEPAAPAVQDRPPPASTAARQRKSPAPAQSTRRERSTPRPAADVTPTPTVELAPRSSASEDQQVPERASAQQPPSFDLSPLAAARTLGDSTYFPVRDAGAAPPDEALRSPSSQANALAREVPGLRASGGRERSLERAASDVIEDTLYGVLRPWKLLRKTMGDSQYRYTGAGFDAAILPDGRVRFREKDGVRLSSMVTANRESGPSAQLPPAATAGVSLGDPRALWLRLHGKDPFAAERRTFLARTRALREYLAGRAAGHETPIDDEGTGGAESVEPQLEPEAVAR